MELEFFGPRGAKTRKAADVESARRNAQPPGEGLGEGLGDRSRRLMSGTWLWKDPEGTRRPGSNHPARRPRWAADRFAHSAGPGSNISLHPGPFLRPSAPRGRQLGTKKSKNGANNPPRWGPEAPKSSQDGVNAGTKPRKSRIKEATQQRRG